jgi:vitamin K-dependent gamma-carboxylase
MATETLERALFRPVDASSVVAFRAIFGALMFVAVLRFFANGWIDEYYLQPSHFLHYYGFEWVRPWPGAGMYVHFALMALLSLGIVFGVYYRFSVAAFGALFAYAHLIDKTNYLNHYYLVVCLCALMAFLPLHRFGSVDAWRKPSLRSETVPAWVLYALRAQVGLVYLFGGVAKLDADWLFDAQPLTIWLSANGDFPIVGALFGEKWVAYAMSWGGAVFDLSIVPLLLWKRSRAFAYVALVVFHLVTARLFHLGMFPWIMMGSALLFFSPEWPRLLISRWRSIAPAATPPVAPRANRLAPVLLAAYFGFHLLFPLRHHLYPGDASWSEEGFRFAWNVMLMEKDGSVEYRVREPSTGREWLVSPTDYLTRYQAKMMASQPDMILELAHVIERDFEARGVRDPQVRADAFASLNGRPMARLVDPTVDLTEEAEGFAPKRWILAERSAR